MATLIIFTTYVKLEFKIQMLYITFLVMLESDHTEKNKTLFPV